MKTLRSLSSAAGAVWSALVWRITTPSKCSVNTSFPTRPGQAPPLKQYAGLASCRTAGAQCFYKLYTEDGPNLDLGDLSEVHARWDLMLCTDSIDYNVDGTNQTTLK